MKKNLFRSMLVFAILGVAFTGTKAQSDITNGSGTISSQFNDSPSGEDVTKVIDNNSATKYLTFNAAAWIQWQVGSGYIVTSYSITSANDAEERDPLSWTFQGSNNGSTWATLDSRSGQDFPSRNQKKTYSFSNSNSYTYYKLNMNNNSGTILQLAEWEIFGTAASGSNVTPNVEKWYVLKNRNSGLNMRNENCNTANETPVELFDGTGDCAQWRFVKNGSYWTIKNCNSNLNLRHDGTSVVSDETIAELINTTGDRTYFQIISAPTTGYVHLRHAGSGLNLRNADCQGINDETRIEFYSGTGDCAQWQLIEVGDVSGSGDWTGFVYPTVTFTDQAIGTSGSAILATAVPDIQAMMRGICLEICKTIYSDNNDYRNNFTKLNLILTNNPNDVAWKAGNPPEITIGIGYAHIENVYNNNGHDYSIVRKEVEGVLAHEGTHGYQWEPKNCGTYDGSSVFWGFIEGEADGVRAILRNWTPTRYPSLGGNWNDGYTTGGFFLKWCKDNKKSTFMIDINHYARDMSTFTWDGAFQQILGQSVQTVWNEYQNSLKSAPAVPMSVVNVLPEFTAYPNPMSDILNIDLEGEVENTVANIYSITGTKVLTQNLNGNANSINVSELPKGAYLLVINQNGNIIKKKIIK